MDTHQSLTRSFACRSSTTASWVIPGALLVLLPKCPMCLAAYIAMFSGIALPFSAAASLRFALIGACSASLAYVAIRRLRRHFLSQRSR